MSFKKKSMRLKVSLSILLAVMLGLITTLFVPEHIQKSHIVSIFCTLIGVFLALVLNSERTKTKNITRQIEIYSNVLKLSRKSSELSEKAIISAIEKMKLGDSKSFYKYYMATRDPNVIEIIGDLNIRQILKLHELQEEAMRKVMILDVGEKTKDELKAMTVTQLFLLEKRKELSKAKVVSIISAAVGAASIYFRISDAYFVFVLPLIIAALLTCFELVLTYRVEKGYFGANKHEAIQLLQYIEKNKDDFDSDGKGGFNRKIFNELKQSSDEMPSSIDGGVII